jgi:hypothetical protein
MESFSKEIEYVKKNEIKSQGGTRCLYSQHSGSRDRKIESFSLAWALQCNLDLKKKVKQRVQLKE